MDANDLSLHFSSDREFDSQFPAYIKKLSEVHWTPLQVAFTAAKFLAPDANARIMDIGAGVGKFCMAGAWRNPGSFTGIEQRKNFARIGNKVISKMGLTNAKIIHGNFLDLDLKEYTGIYFFNSFHENLVDSDALDHKIERSPELYAQYSLALLERLKEMPSGTRLATYYLAITEVDKSYRLQTTHFGDLLKLWIKE